MHIYVGYGHSTVLTGTQTNVIAQQNCEMYKSYLLEIEQLISHLFQSRQGDFKT